METSQIKKKFYRSLPEVIKSTLIISEGWLTGSAIKSLLEDKKVNDYDIAVSQDKWVETINHLKQYPHSINTFGGFKFLITPENGLTYELDIWPQDFDGFLKRASSYTYLYNLKYQRLLQLVN